MKMPARPGNTLTSTVYSSRCGRQHRVRDRPRQVRVRRKAGAGVSPVLQVSLCSQGGCGCGITAQGRGKAWSCRSEGGVGVVMQIRGKGGCGCAGQRSEWGVAMQVRGRGGVWLCSEKRGEPHPQPCKQLRGAWSLEGVFLEPWSSGFCLAARLLVTVAAPCGQFP